MELGRTDAKKAGRWQITNVRGGIVPYIRLKEWFMINGGCRDIEQIVITKTDSRRVGFVVDSIVGERQTVVKALGRVYRDIQGISGATILGNGRVGLIIDVPQIIREAETFFSERSKK